MGIESDKLVFDYLSKVGDLAQTQLAAADRMRLVARLRNDIDRARDKTSGDSPAAVRRILGRLGSPDEIVEAASGAGSPYGPGYGTSPQTPAAPAPRTPAAAQAPAAPVDLGKPRTAGPRAPGTTPPPSVNDILAATGPAAADGDGDGTEWWRTPAGGGPGEGTLGSELSTAGWTGGLILSEFQPPAPLPPTPEQLQAAALAQAQAAAQYAAAPAVQPAPPAKRPFRIPRIRLRPLPPPPAPVVEAAPPARRGIPAGPVEVLAAAGLVTGALLGNVIVLAAGWVLAYTTRGIARKQARFAVLGLPGITVIGALVWFWGRATGHWGPALAGARIGTDFTADLPGIARVAAVVSALYLLWRGLVKRG